MVCERKNLRIADTPEPTVPLSPGTDWQSTSDNRQETTTAVLRPREDAAIPAGAAAAAPTTRLQATLATPERRAYAGAFRSNWAATLKLSVDEPDLVPCSALTLKGLVHYDADATMTPPPPRSPKGSSGIHTSTAIESRRSTQVDFSQARRDDHLSTR